MYCFLLELLCCYIMALFHLKSQTLRSSVFPVHTKGNFRLCNNNNGEVIACHTVQGGFNKILVAIRVRLYDINLSLSAADIVRIWS